MERIRIALVTLAALVAAPAAHAYGNYLSGYGGGSSSYLSSYSGGGNRYYNPGGGHYVSKIGGSVGSIDRRGARPQTVKVRQPVYTSPPCGNYLRKPEHCRNVTMAYNPAASTSRTGQGFHVPLLNRTYYVYTRNPFSDVRVEPKE